MEIHFDKYQGAGNDFILLDNRQGNYTNLTMEQRKSLCNRNMGIGADGLILIVNSTEADFEMRYFNSDGNLSTLCGNGGRCAVAFAHHKKMIGEETRFMAIDGIHRAQLVSSDLVRLEMQEVHSFTSYYAGVVTDTGSPHYVQLVKEAATIDVQKEGAAIRYSEAFAPEGINVNFVEKKTEQHFVIRTYERGVENETLACGTGAVAAALVLHFLGETGGATQVELQAPGGVLNVDFELNQQTYQNVHLQGPATFVFSGTITL
jgi:diaminopimelate epimerase